MELGPGCCCVPARHRALVLELWCWSSWLELPPGSLCLQLDFYGKRDRAGRREITVGRRVVFCRGGKKDGMSLEAGERKRFWGNYKRM